jgi:hypothetical protein
MKNNPCQKTLLEKNEILKMSQKKELFKTKWNKNKIFFEKKYFRKKNN